MNTKLVYVLTCAPEHHYIEQALMAVYSARHWNPDAHIVLITDNLTSQLIHDTGSHRSDILQHITEEVVVPFEDDSLSMMYRSRWIKTSVRQLIDGDYLFIDCDTICCRSLADADNFDCEIGAVLDCHREMKDIDSVDQANIRSLAAKCGWNFENLKWYISSGVLFVKDDDATGSFYVQWHDNWLHSQSCGVGIDQISFAQTNENVHLVSLIPDTWNCIMFTRPNFAVQSYILHFAALDNPSFLYTERVFDIIQNHGLSDYLKSYILCPTHSYFPYTRADYKAFFSTLRWLSESVREYGTNIDASYADIHIKSRFSNNIIRLFQNGQNKLGTFLWMMWTIFKRNII